MNRKCTICQETKPLAAFYAGQYRCKICHKAAVTKAQAADPASSRERQARWRERNPGKVREKRRAYYEQNRERELERQRQYRAENREQIRESESQRKRNRRKPAGAGPPKPAKTGRPKTKRPDPAQQPPAGAQPVKELRLAVDHFLTAKGLKETKTQLWYSGVLKQYVNFVLAHHQPHWPVDPDAVNGFLTDCARRGCKQGTVNGYYRAIRCWLNWLAGRKRIEGEILGLIERVGKPKSLPKAADEKAVLSLIETIRRAIQHSKNWRYVRDLALFTLALDAGARIGELASLEIDDLNLAHHAISVRAEQTKTDESRTLVIAGQTVTALEAWLTVRAGLKPAAELKAVFVSNYQKAGLRPWTDSGIRTRLTFWQQKTGIDSYYHFHQLRHSSAVFSLRVGMDLLDLQKQMGHRNLATTQRYAMVDDRGRAGRHQSSNALAYLASV